MERDNNDNKKIWDFVRKLMTDKGEAEDAEKAGELKWKLENEIQKAILMALPEENFDAFEKEAEKDDPNEEILNTIIDSAGLDLEKIAQETLDKFRNEYMKGGEQ